MLTCVCVCVCVRVCVRACVRGACVTASHLACVRAVAPPPPARHDGLHVVFVLFSPAQEAKTRRLFWDKVSGGGSGGGAVWDKVESMDDVIDRNEVETLFGRAAPKKKKAAGSGGGGKGKGKKKGGAGGGKDGGDGGGGGDDAEQQAPSVFEGQLQQLEICLRGLVQLGYATGRDIVAAMDNLQCVCLPVAMSFVGRMKRVVGRACAVVCVCGCVCAWQCVGGRRAEVTAESL